jgi:hypothetical protein
LDERFTCVVMPLMPLPTKNCSVLQLLVAALLLASP